MSHVITYARTFTIFLLLMMAVSVGSAQWEEIPNAPVSSAAGMTAIHNGRLYSFGGAGATSLLASGYVLDPNVDGAVWTSVADMPRGRFAGYAAAVNGKIYIVGGSYVPSGTPTGSVLEFDPVTNAYSEKTTVPIPVAFFGGAVVNGKIYMIGGENQSGSIAAVQVYDPASNTWSTSTDFPTTIGTTTATAVGSDIYVVAGLVTAQGPVTAAAYKGTVTGSTIAWKRLADYPLAMFDGASGTVGGTLYAATGTTDNGFANKMYSYDVASDSWKQEFSLPVVTTGVNAMPNDGESMYWIRGYQNNRSFRFTPTAAAAVAEFSRASVVVTMRKGATPSTRQQRVTIANKGLLPLEVKVEVPAVAGDWLSSNVTTSTVAPEASVDVTFTLNASTLDVGPARASVLVRTNDPKRAETLVDVRLFVVETTVDQPTNVVVEEGSGDWCGFCPDGHQTLETIKKTYGDQAIVLSYHGGSSSEPLMFSEGVSVLNSLGLNGWPNASFQRRSFSGESAPMVVDRSRWSAYAGKILQENPNAPIAMYIDDYVYDKESRLVSATIRMVVDEAIPMRQLTTLRLSAMVKQQGIMTTQVESTGNGTKLHESYEQRDAVRMIFPNAGGTELSVPGSAIQEGVLLPGTEMIQSVVFTVNVPSGAPGTEFKSENAQIVFVVHQNHGPDLGEIFQGVSRELESEPVFPSDVISATTGVSVLTVKPTETAIFETIVMNLTDNIQGVTVTRTDDQLPSGWTGVMILDGIEYPAGSVSENVEIAPGSSIKVHLTVQTDARDNAQGTATLRFESGATTVDQTYTVRASSGTSGVEGTAAAGGLSLSVNAPIRAGDPARLAYTLAHSGSPVIELFAISGECLRTFEQGRREAGSHELMLDLASLPTGMYLVALRDGEKIVGRTIHLIR